MEEVKKELKYALEDVDPADLSVWRAKNPLTSSRILRNFIKSIAFVSDEDIEKIRVCEKVAQLSLGKKEVLLVESPSMSRRP